MGDLEKPMHVDPVRRFFQVFRGARKKKSCANHNIVIDPGEVDVPEGFLHIKEPATVGMEMLYSSLVRLK